MKISFLIHLNIISFLTQEDKYCSWTGMAYSEKDLNSPSFQLGFEPVTSLTAHNKTGQIKEVEYKPLLFFVS